jgi:hypothetical protein
MSLRDEVKVLGHELGKPLIHFKYFISTRRKRKRWKKRRGSL